MSVIEHMKRVGFFTYGTTIDGLVIHGKPAPYPVLNERAIRAGAGIMFVMAAFAFSQAWYLADYLPLKLVVVIFFVEFIMKVIVGTRFAPIGSIAAFMVRGQAPEYVGAVQKRFAWSLGLVLASAMILLLFAFDVRGPVNLAVCSICLTFMFLESSFGICVGCKIYNALLAWGLIATPLYKPVCPGNVCAIE
ncbi:DUF4395 domain-containing protein [Patescibacteria group bacterium]|nr:DUF4395 domain-containing protein [Patescibacteria group bacterium]